MIRALSTFGLCLAALAAAPAAVAAGVGATAQAQATIVEAGSLTILWPMAMPTVRGVGSGALFVGNMPSMGMGGRPMMGDKPFVVRHGAESSAVTAPASFAVEQTSGEQALVMKTRGAADPVVDEGLFLGGALFGASAASVTLADTTQAVSGAGGPSGQTLVVMVQYN